MLTSVILENKLKHLDDYKTLTLTQTVVYLVKIALDLMFLHETPPLGALGPPL